MAMADSQATTASLAASDPSSSAGIPEQAGYFDLSAYPRMFVLPAFLKEGQLAETELNLRAKGAELAVKIEDAQLILTGVSKARRAEYELRSYRLKLEQIGEAFSSEVDIYDEPKRSHKRKVSPVELGSSPSRKGRRISAGSRVASEPAESDADSLDSNTTLGKVESVKEVSQSQQEQKSDLAPFHNRLFVKIIRIAWLAESIALRKLQPLIPYTLCEGKRVILSDLSTNQATNWLSYMPQEESAKPNRSLQVSDTISGAHDSPKRIIDLPQNAVQVDQNALTSSGPQYSIRNPSFRKKAKRPALLRETTSEYEEAKHVEVPDWVKEGRIYACERRTLQHSPNEGFLNQLRSIRHARELMSDEIGVRAYSSIIASIAAYPTELKVPNEILALPSCEEKAAGMFRQYQTEGFVEEARRLEKDDFLKTVDLFWKIHGVGPATARQFVSNGWKDMDDVVEYGWKDLPFEQRVGVKYYAEFEKKIPRAESESIALVIVEHAKRLLGEDVRHMIVGGYRRGKPESGDVDIILSHPNEETTLDIIEALVASLGKSGHVTHQLELHTSNSKRGQQPIPANIIKSHLGGFDTLDKALLVWQDPSWPTKSKDLAANSKAKNSAIHRRVDIIISPWKTVGCAVTGWTSGTTFQRDVRRYAKHKKNWKFDSSGARDRRNGNWIDLERWTDPKERAKTIEEAERRVFAGLGLEWREPWERCTD